MKLQNALFAVVCIRPQSIRDLMKKLPFSRHSVYKALEKMTNKGLITKKRQGKDVLVAVSSDYKSQKTREFYLKTLSLGIDPETILNDTMLLVLKATKDTVTIEGVIMSTGLSYLTVLKAMHVLIGAGILTKRKDKPLTASRNADSGLNRILTQIIDESIPSRPIYSSGTSPFELAIEDPDTIERMLYAHMDSGLSIRGTGFVVKGNKRLKLLESSTLVHSLEEAFLKDLMTPEGVEDLCIQMLHSNRLDLDVLLELAVKNKMTSEVGCYLDVLNSIKPFVPENILEEFSKRILKRRKVFLKTERRSGKQGWEDKYEKKWNLDLYLDRGAIEHGVRGL